MNWLKFYTVRNVHITLYSNIIRISFGNVCLNYWIHHYVIIKWQYFSHCNDEVRVRTKVWNINNNSARKKYVNTVLHWFLRCSIDSGPNSQKMYKLWEETVHFSLLLRRLFPPFFLPSSYSLHCCQNTQWT